MVAFALQSDGWYLRQDIIWHKPATMPESVTDRCTKAHEYIFLLSKSAQYYYDHEAIKESVANSTVKRISQANLACQTGSDRVPGKTNGPMKAVSNGTTRNKRSVWTVATKPFKRLSQTSHWDRVEADAFSDGMKRITSPSCPVHGHLYRQYDEHGACAKTHTEHNAPCLFELQQHGMTANSNNPDKLPLGNKMDCPGHKYFQTATSHNSENYKMDHDFETIPPYTFCAQIPYHIEHRLKELGWSEPCLYRLLNNTSSDGLPDNLLQQILSDKTGKLEPLVCLASDKPPNNCICLYYHKTTKKTSHFATFPPKLIEPCILAGCPKGGIVLDPFFGSGTTGFVAAENNRKYIGIELNPEYIKIAKQRVRNAEPSLF